ncbi:MAG: alpha/beta hydrolase [Nocardioides sp.]
MSDHESEQTAVPTTSSATVPAHVSAEDYAEVLEGRADMVAEAAAEVKEPVARVADADADGVPVRIYVPEAPRGTLLYLHGGGFVFGSPTTHDGFIRRLANRTHYAVCAVDYRLAPEHPYPAAVDDTETAAEWWAAHAGDFGLDPGATVPLGDSAGAALALGLTLRHPGRYRTQVLVYPFVDPSMDSYDRDLVDPDLDLEACEWFWANYAPDATRHTEVDLDPLRADSFAGQPATLIQLAQDDVLVPTAHDLSRRMSDAGVGVTLRTYAGVGHGFWRRDNDAAEAALADIAAYLETGTLA